MLHMLSRPGRIPNAQIGIHHRHPSPNSLPPPFASNITDQPHHFDMIYVEYVIPILGTIQPRAGRKASNALLVFDSYDFELGVKSLSHGEYIEKAFH
jgi:hypothetical protein